MRAGLGLIGEVVMGAGSCKGRESRWIEEFLPGVGSGKGQGQARLH